jgi:hypothetical protein
VQCFDAFTDYADSIKLLRGMNGDLETASVAGTAMAVKTPRLALGEPIAESVAIRTQNRPEAVKTHPGAILAKRLVFKQKATFRANRESHTMRFLKH